jgi:hypothetical protein
MTIFSEYYLKQDFIDRFEVDELNGVDVIIPVYHTNELWHTNLLSIYREVPVRRLLISDGGVIDNSIDQLKDFPRVFLYNHRHFNSLGKCIAELIKEVTSEWFIYLHSDVYLPKGWFNTMISHKNEFDWYGCPMNITIMVNYKLVQPLRPYAGSQMGRKAAFMEGIDMIEDDFVYRQEDFVFNRIVEDAGYKTGKVEDTFHYHQLMYRKSDGFDLNIKEVKIETHTKENENLRMLDTQLRGIVKYLDPIEEYVIMDFKSHVAIMLEKKLISYKSFRTWILLHNPNWLPLFNYKLLIKVFLYSIIKNLEKSIKKFVRL